MRIPSKRQNRHCRIVNNSYSSLHDGRPTHRSRIFETTFAFTDINQQNLDRVMLFAQKEVYSNPFKGLVRIVWYSQATC